MYCIFNAAEALPCGGDSQGKKSKDSGTSTFYLENDTFTGTDSHYTSGLRLTWVSPDFADYRERPLVPEWGYPLVEKLPFANRSGFHRHMSLCAGQNIYTPEDISRSELIKDDRPYAGITYVSLGSHSSSSHRMDSLEFDLGIVGPHSYAEQCQAKVHEWIDSTDPQG